MRTESKIMVGLDIGTSKVVTIVAESSPQGELEIIGVGEHSSLGMKKGVVINIESTVESIRHSVQDAELMAGCNIHSVNVSIAGSHIKSFNSHGAVKIKDHEVTEEDVERAIDAARAVVISGDTKILHVLPQQYLIDGQEGIRKPIGMSGVRLETEVHLVTSSISAIQNITKCIERCNLEAEDITLDQLASAHAVLTDDEKELGVCLVDIGGGTTDIAIFKNGAIHYTSVIPVAGDQVTSDIAMALRTPTKYAEEIKLKYACALRQLTNVNETIEVSGIGNRPNRRMERQVLAEVVEPRYDELFGLVRAELAKSGLKELCTAGIVLTGGSSKMEGAIELAEEIFHMPVRLGVPKGIIGLSDMVKDSKYATAVGLLIASQQSHPLNDFYHRAGHSDSLLNRIKQWFNGNF